MSDEGKMPGKKWLGILAVGFVGIAPVVIAFAAWLAESQARDVAAAKEVQERLAAIRQSGQPISFQDLAVRYPDPPPEHDAELLLKPALTAFIRPTEAEHVPFFGGDWPSSDTALSPQLLEVLRATLEKNRKALETIPSDELKSAWVGSRFARGWTNFNQTSSTAIGNIAKMLCLEAVFKAEMGKSAEASASLEKALLIDRTLRNDTLVHGLFRASLCQRACDSLNQMLNRAEFSDSDLQAISSLMPVLEIGNTKELLINDRCLEITEAEAFKSLAEQIKAGHQPDRDKWWGSVAAHMIYRDQDFLEYLNNANSNIMVMDLPISNAIPKLVELDKIQGEKKDRDTSDHSGFGDSFFPHKSTLCSILVSLRAGSMLTSGVKNVAYERAAMTAIAVERYRLSHAAHLPENLSVLVPEYLPSVPKDPFDGRELRFKKLERGYAVYSVGPDFTDDNGEPEPKAASHPIHYDVVFSLVR